MVNVKGRRVNLVSDLPTEDLGVPGPGPSTWKNRNIPFRNTPSSTLTSNKNHTHTISSSAVPKPKPANYTDKVNPNSSTEVRKHPKKRVIVTDKREREEMVTNFFTKLFQGYHGKNGEVTDDVFEPQFDNLNFFLRGLGQLDDVSAETMTNEITEEEVKLAIENSKGNKSPGLDGITYEFYKKSKDALVPILTEIFNEQLGRL